MGSKDNLCYDKKLIAVWLEDMKKLPSTYYKPILDEDTTAFMKEISVTFKYSDEVFVMSVQVLEDLMRRTDMALSIIDDPVLSTFCIIFICGKYTSKKKRRITCETLKHYLTIHSMKKYDLPRIKSAEIEILRAIDYILPKNTKSEDLNTLYMYFLHPLKVKTKALELCTELLNVVIIYWPTVYHKLSSVYSGTTLKESVFKSLLSHRCYIPSGIILTAMRMIEMFKVFDKDRIGADLQEITEIHIDHLVFLCDVLYKIAKKKKK